VNSVYFIFHIPKFKLTVLFTERNCLVSASVGSDPFRGSDPLSFGGINRSPLSHQQSFFAERFTSQNVVQAEPRSGIIVISKSFCVHGYGFILI